MPTADYDDEKGAAAVAAAEVPDSGEPVVATEADTAAEVGTEESTKEGDDDMHKAEVPVARPKLTKKERKKTQAAAAALKEAMGIEVGLKARA